MEASAQLGYVPRRAGDFVRRTQPRVVWAVFAVFAVAMAVFLVYQTRGTTFWNDEWGYVYGRRGDALGTFLRPYNGHLNLIPVAIYRALFATAGLSDYTPYRVLVIVGHVVCVTLVLVYARRRVGGLLALLVATLLLAFGPGWQLVIWPFQIAWLISLAAGVGAFIALDRPGRLGDASACVLIAISLASSGVGAAFPAGAAVDLIARRRWRQSTWVVGVPIFLYVIWWAVYQNAPLYHYAVILAPNFIAQQTAASISGLMGLSGLGETPLTWGAPLLVAALAAGIYRVVRLGFVPGRVLALLTALLVFLLATAVSGSVTFTDPLVSRYIYVTAVFILLIAVELARGVPSPRPLLGAILIVAVFFAVISNIGAFRDASGFLRGQAETTRAALGAFNLARPFVKRDYLFSGLGSLHAQNPTPIGPLFAAEDALASPRYMARDIERLGDEARAAADTQLLRVPEIDIEPAGRNLHLGPAPTVDHADGLLRSGSVGCLDFAAPGFTPTGPTSGLAVTVPDGGLLVRASNGVTRLNARRFASSFQPLGTLAAPARGVLRSARDRGGEPWHLQLVPTGSVQVCGLG